MHHAKTQYHFFLCNSFRINGEPQGSCNRKGSPGLLQYLQNEITDRGIDAVVSTTSCLNVARRGRSWSSIRKRGGTSRSPRRRSTRFSTPWNRTSRPKSC